MSNLEYDLTKINHLMATYVLQIKGAVAQKRYNLNIVSETILLPIFKIAYDAPNLVNRNEIIANDTAIDHSDEEKKLCIQITSDPKLSKIKSTIKKFLEKKLHKKYDRLIVYIITEKNKSYSQSAINRITQKNFKFDVKNDIVDYQDLQKNIGTKQIDKVSIVRQILEANFEKGVFPVSQLLDTETETLYLNWLPMEVSDTLYVATLNTNKNEIIEASKWLSSWSSEDQIVSEHLKAKGLNKILDWVVFDKSLITFRNLTSENEPLRDVISVGTIETYKTPDFISTGSNYENQIKILFRKCLQQKLIPHSFVWKYKESLFIALPTDQDATERKMVWKSTKTNKKQVYWHTKKKEKPEETLSHKHFAFSVNFQCIENQWYLIVTPTWFISWDGNKKSFYAGDSIKKIKGYENNYHVLNHTRFISYLLRDPGLPLFENEYPYIRTGELIEINGSPKFSVSDWQNPDEGTEDEVPYNILEEI